MATGTTKEQLTILETRFETLQRRFEESSAQAPLKAKRGWKAIIGTFADDAFYDEAMQRGRAWRENQYDEETMAYYQSLK